MPRFSLRTLIVVMLLGGPVLWGAWWVIRPIPPLYVALFAICAAIAFAQWLDGDRPWNY